MKTHISWQSQPFKAALSALSNLICFKSYRSHGIISGLESSENRCAALLSLLLLFKGDWLGARLIRLANEDGGTSLLSWAPVTRMLTHSWRPQCRTPGPTDLLMPHPRAQAVAGPGYGIVHPVPRAFFVFVQVGLALKAKAWWSCLPR